MKLVEAIAHIEGYYTKGTRPERNNNPGDLEFHEWMVAKYGATMETGTPHPRFAHYPNPEIGFKAMTDLLGGKHYGPMTIRDAINTYAPPTENNTGQYVRFVCANAECQPTDIVADILKRDA